MGNHNVGRAMSAGAIAAMALFGNLPTPIKMTKEWALTILDALAEPWLGADAEFDDELSEETALSILVAVAFEATPAELADLRGEGSPSLGDDHGQLWFDGPCTRFRERYKFC